MKIKTILLAISLIIGLLVASCGASKSCPAYSKATTEQNADAAS
jgi:hypothetical protein